MATRAEIYYVGDGKIQSIYSHYDGYPEGLGDMLFSNYQDPKKIKKLVSLGSVSFVDKLVEPNDPSHSFDTPEKGVTVAYHRDRGEDLDITTKPLLAIDVEDILQTIYQDSREEYSYVYITSEKTWFVLDINEGSFNAKLLSKALGEEEPNRKDEPKKPNKPKTFITRNKSVKIARTLRTNQTSYYRIIEGLGGKPTEVISHKETLQQDGAIIFQVNWIDFARELNKRPTQAELADYIYRRGNYEANKHLK